MVSIINVVVTCTNQKTVNISPSNMLRDVTASSISAAFAEWKQKLDRGESSPVIASDLYKGEIWHVVKSLRPTAFMAQWDAHIWVCSAGYGLVEMDTPLKPYSATFDPSSADSVGRWSKGGSASSAAWWEMLSEWPGPTDGQKRSIQSVAAAAPDVPMLVAASRDYMKAMATDVSKAKKKLSSPDNLIICSVGSDLPEELVDNGLGVDSRLQAKVDGSLHSINVRLAKRILEESNGEALKAPSLRAHYAEVMERLPARGSHKRDRQSDEEVKQFIIREREQLKNASASKLLRLFRDSGMACEQSRFSELFKAIPKSQ